MKALHSGDSTKGVGPAGSSACGREGHRGQNYVKHLVQRVALCDQQQHFITDMLLLEGVGGELL